MQLNIIKDQSSIPAMLGISKERFIELQKAINSIMITKVIEISNEDEVDLEEILNELASLCNNSEELVCVSMELLHKLEASCNISVTLEQLNTETEEIANNIYR